MTAHDCSELFRRHRKSAHARIHPGTSPSTCELTRQSLTKYSIRICATSLIWGCAWLRKREWCGATRRRAKGNTSRLRAAGAAARLVGTQHYGFAGFVCMSESYLYILRYHCSGPVVATHTRLGAFLPCFYCHKTILALGILPFSETSSGPTTHLEGAQDETKWQGASSILKH